MAVDDMGAGYSGLGQIMALHPRYLKLDRSLIKGIDVDRERAALVGALTEYARRVDSLLVAEGMESAAELRTLIELGVPLAQGYYLARPARPWPLVAPGLLSPPAERAGSAVRREPPGSASSARQGSTTTSLLAARSSE